MITPTRNSKRSLCIVAFIFSCMLIVPAAFGQPQVHTDGRVTFTFQSPHARKVRLVASFSHKKLHMQRQGDIFTFTTQPLTSEMYTYYYIVDGKTMLDPKNSHVTRDISLRLNFFFVPGEVADRYMDHKVAHGQVDTVWYFSTLNGMSQRRMLVYTPPGYSADSTTTYPVLYLHHGSGGDETSWTDYGRARQILDNMINRQETPPLIVCMPNGNVELDAAPGESPYMNKQPSGNNITSMVGKYETSFPNEIVKYVETHYRVKADKSHRAIAGLSMGGLHALFISLNNPQMFDFVGLFSAQTTNMFTKERIFKVERFNYNMQRIRYVMAIMGDRVARPVTLSDKLSCLNIYDNIEEKLSAQFNPAPRLYYMAIGRDDFLQTMNRDHRTLLDSHNYPYTFIETDGNHSWENWRSYLVDFLKRISPYWRQAPQSAN